MHIFHHDEQEFHRLSIYLVSHILWHIEHSKPDFPQTLLASFPFAPQNTFSLSPW